LREVRKLCTKHVYKKELSMAKEFLRGQTLLNMEDTSGVMLWAGENKLLSGSVPRVGDILEGVGRVTADDIRRVALSIFREEKLNLALIGPNDRKEIEKAYGV
jgi:predicted Zn-dependent peptidase